MCATPKLASMQALLNDADALHLERLPISALHRGTTYAEPLLCNRMTVLKARITNIARLDARVFCQLLAYPVSVGAGFPYTQPVMFAIIAELDLELLGYNEVFGYGANPRCKQRWAECAGPIRQI